MRSSRIFGYADALSGYLARVNGRSVLLRGALLAAERVSRGFGESCFSRMGEERLAHRIALRDRGRLARLMETLRARLLLAPASSLAVLLALYGSTSAVLLLLNGREGSILPLLVSLGLLSAAVPFLHLQTPIGRFLSQSAVVGWVLRFCGIAEEELPREGEGRFPWLAVGAGIGLGILGGRFPYVPPLLFVLGAVGGLLFRVPELLLLLLLALFPFLGFFAHPTLLLLGGALLLEVTFLGKYRHGRRTVRMGYLQMLVLLLALLFDLGGAVGYGGGATLADGLARALLVLLFFPVSSLLESRLWRRRARRALQGSTALLSLMGILQYCFTEMELKWVDVDRFSSLGGRVSLSFGNPNILASFLLLALPLALGGLTDRTERVGWRIGFGIAAGLEGVCLVLTWSRGAWLGAAVGVLFLFLLLGRRARARTVIGLPLIGLSAPLWPSNLLLRLGSIGRLADSSTRYRLYTWKGVLRMLAAHPFGIGSGEAAFRAVYPTYAVSGTETVMHAHNLLLGATAALGLPGTAVLLLLLLLWGLEVLRGCFLLTGENRADLLAPSAGIVSLLVMGCFDDPWYHFGVFAMLWILLALSAAAFADGEGARSADEDADTLVWV